MTVASHLLPSNYGDVYFRWEAVNYTAGNNTWADSSGYGRNVTWSVLPSGTTQSAEFGGNKIITLGVPGAWGASVAFPALYPSTIVWCAKGGVIGAGDFGIMFEGQAASLQTVHLAGATGGYARNPDLLTFSSAGRLYSAHVGYVVFNGASSVSGLNTDQAENAANAGASSITQMYIGARNGGSYRYRGWLAEIVGFAGVLNRRQLSGVLRGPFGKYNVPLI